MTAQAQEWHQQGSTLRERRLYALAAKCFEQAGDRAAQLEAQARQQRQLAGTYSPRTHFKAAACVASQTLSGRNEGGLGDDACKDESPGAGAGARLLCARRCQLPARACRITKKRVLVRG